MPWLATVVFLGVGGWSLLPPSPVSATAPADRFSAERAMVHVGVIAREPHPVGTPANAEVRAYIVGELERLGVEVELQTTTASDCFGNREPVPVVNIIARLPGTAPTKAVALIGHYDTIPTTAGGNDNTAAVAAMLETGRALLAGPSVRNDVYLIFTDGEEPAPRFGATAFVGSHPVVGEIGLVVNFEASGGSGASVLSETSGPERWLIDELAEADGHPAAFSFVTETTRLLGDIGTDFDSFRNAGVAGLHFAYLHGSPIYHTEADNAEAVSDGSLQHHGAHALGIARHFGELDLTDPGPADRAVFFSVRPFFVRYSAVWAIPLALLATVACAFGLWRGRGTPGASASAVLRSLIRTGGGGLLATTAGTIAWLLIAAARSAPGVVESIAYFGCVLAVAVLVGARISPGRNKEGRRGVVLIWITLSLLTAVWLPGFSYLFVWPLLAFAATLFRGAESGRWSGTIRYLVVAAPTLILMTPAVDIFFQFAQPRPGNPDSEMRAAVALPLLLALLSLGLLRTVWPRRAIQDAS
jgi:hypothetical protein